MRIKRKEDRDMWQAWLNIAVGIWLIICAFVPALWTPASMIVPGVVSFVFGFWGGGMESSWQGYVNGVIGTWLFLSGIWFMLYEPWNFFLSGIVVTVLAIWNSIQHQHPMHAAAH